MSLDIQIYMRWTLLYIIGCIYFTVFRYLYIYNYIYGIFKMFATCQGAQKEIGLYFFKPPSRQSQDSAPADKRTHLSQQH